MPGSITSYYQAVYGLGEGRRYLAAFPVPGSAPDFHRLEYFGVLELS